MNYRKTKQDYCSKNSRMMFYRNDGYAEAETTKDKAADDRVFVRIPNACVIAVESLPERLANYGQK